MTISHDAALCAAACTQGMLYSILLVFRLIHSFVLVEYTGRLIAETKKKKMQGFAVNTE
jgi:hypothetical protein